MSNWAENGRVVLEHFVEWCEEPDFDLKGNVETALVDLLSDLMHLCDHEQVDFDICLQKAAELHSDTKE